MTQDPVIEFFRAEFPDLRFSMLDIGARKEPGSTEPFYALIDQFPGSIVTAIESDEYYCEQQSARSQNGIKYYPQALGKENGHADYYETIHPMCNSLLEPDTDLLDKYNGLEIMKPQAKKQIETVTLDDFISNNGIGEVDYIKINVQGSELNILEAGSATLQNVTTLVCSADFIPFYRNQALFGDISQFLSNQGFMFHKFLWLAGRALKPITYSNDPNIGPQHLWSFAMFVREIGTTDDLSRAQLVKSAAYAHLYGSIDVANYYLSCLDQRDGSSDLAVRYSHSAQATV